MAADYPYPVLVELEENSAPRLKNKLVKYFQSKKSNGGDCQVDYESGSTTALLRFRREEDQRNVLAKEAHKITLDQGVLKMKVSLPSEGEKGEPSDKGNKKSDHAAINKELTADEHNPVDEGQTRAKGGDGDSADEELCSTSAVLGNIPESATFEFLDMLVENISREFSSPTASEGYTLEVIPDISSAVVTFQRAKDNTEFIERCPLNRMFTKKDLSVRPLETTKKVVVEGASDISEDILSLYFESKGGEVEDVQLNEAEQTAVITFKNHQAVKKVLSKKHEIKKEEVKVYPYYKSLGVALYGKDKPSPKLPAAISEPIDNAVLRYLANNKAALETVRCDLEKKFCSVTLEPSAVRLSALPLLLKQKDSRATIKEWPNAVKSAFAQAVSKFKSIRFSLESEVWEESQQKIKEKLQKEDVVVVSDKTSGVLSVAGLVNDVDTLQNPVSDILDGIRERARRAKLSKTQEINVSPSMFHILSQNGLKDKLLQVYPELKMSYDQKNKAVKVTGFVDEIIDATKVISNAMFALKRQNLELDQHLLDMLKGEQQQEEVTNALLTAYGLNAALEISPQRVQLVAVSDKDLMNAQDHLSQTLKSQYIEVEDVEVLKNPEWQQLVHKLEKTNSTPGVRTQIITRHQQVVVSGQKDSVDIVSSELEDFLTENAHVEECVEVEANVVIEYLKSQTPWLNQLEGGVEVAFGKEDIILSGRRSAVKDCKTIVRDLVSSVFFDRFTVTKPGVKKFFQEKQHVYAALIKSDTGCLVQLVDDSNHKQEEFAVAQMHKPVYKTQTTDGVEIVVSKADICSYSVDAVVNPSTVDLKHNGGLPLALSTAAGPQLQAECDQIISLKGKLRPGDSVVTDAGGTLRCKKVIHAVGPFFDQTKPKKCEAQLKRTVKESLELAERCGCDSVALPAISRSLNFPLNLCLDTIVKAIKEYCDERYDDNTLKTIHLVDNDDNVILGMEAAVKQEFGNQGVSVFPQSPVPKVIPKSPLGKLAPSDPSLCRAQTKEGLNIVLKKGNIEASKAFTDEFKKKFPSTTSLPVPPRSAAAGASQSTGKFSKVVSSSGMHETKLGNATVQVVTGDITKETTDVIVNSSNEDFSLKSGVSKAIIDAAGVAVLEECQYLGSQPNPGMIMTVPGNLQCRKILHLVGQTDPVKIQKAVKEALEMCLKNSHTSVSFPAIGTGQGNVQAKQVADAMLDAVIDVLNQNPSSSLTLIRIVIFQQPMLKDFYSSMQEREATEPKDKGGFWMNVGHKLKSLFINGSPEQNQEEEMFDFETIKADPAIFHICGDTQANVDAAKKKINTLISDEQDSMKITDNAILNLSSADCQRIADIQKDLGVSIKHDTNNGQTSLVIEGLSRDVLKAHREINVMLTKVRDDQELKKKLELAATVADWQYQRHGLSYQSFDQLTNYELEHALERAKTSVKVTIQGSSYTVQMPNGPATDSMGNILQIRRIDKLRADDVPEFWDTMPAGQTCHAVPIQATSSEYAEVLNLFKATCNRSVTKIERIQNPALWKSLQIKKQEMEVRNKHQNNERRLFHGTSESTVPTINKHGFNRSYAGKNATCYGKGAYFAVNASYSSSDTYSRPNQNGEKFMYLCRVLTGDHALGQQNLIAPPSKGSGVDLYDSVVDNMTTPSMFIVFHDTQAYPEYLITFK
ncbi:poly(ADP-ribose) polymerase family member 14-related sequence 1 isoform 2-T2 [Fundulus diaphanus]